MHKRYFPVLRNLQAYKMNTYNECYHNIKVIITTAYDHVQVTYHFLKNAAYSGNSVPFEVHSPFGSSLAAP